MKEKLKIKLLKLLKEAEKNNIIIVVGQDPEGNGYHSLNHASMFFPASAENDNFIALGVWKGYDEGEIFKSDSY